MMGTSNTVSTSKISTSKNWYGTTLTSSSAVISGTDAFAAPISLGKLEMRSDDEIRALIEEYLKANEPKVYKMTCQSCGAAIAQRIDDHILKCPYCKSAYVIGTKMIYSR